MSINIAKTNPRAGRKNSIGKALQKYWPYYVLLLPAIVYYIIFLYGPMYGLQIAFKDFNGAFGIMGSKWVGFKHFKNFFSSYNFWPLVKNTLSISLYSLIAGFPIPIVLALMLNELKNDKFKKTVQTITYAPHFISTVVLVGIIGVMFAPTYGIFNHARAMLGLERYSFVTEPKAFLHLYVWTGIWQNVGWNSIIYIAVLSGIDVQLREAAVIDGASRFQCIRYINIPSILPTMAILLILNVGSIMNVGFEKVFLMQNDLNKSVSNIISTYVYERGLINADFSFASAVGMFNNVINFALLAITNFLSNKLNGNSLF
jgi:putative aldouronate transport system permease protein